MKDRTAQTEPLTIGQQIVAWWETSTIASEPADLADKIDAALYEACDGGREFGVQFGRRSVADDLAHICANAIRNGDESLARKAANVRGQMLELIPNLKPDE